MTSRQLMDKTEDDRLQQLVVARDGVECTKKRCCWCTQQKFPTKDGKAYNLNQRTKYARYSANAYFGYWLVNGAFAAFCVNVIIGLFAVNCILSVLSINSFGSILSINSVLSILSHGSALSIGCSGKVLEICLPWD